jgi:hypothetical protein
MPTGNFNDGEKITYSLKYALNLTTQFPTKAPALEKPSPPRIFPTSIPKTPLIEKGVGDIDVDGNTPNTEPPEPIDMTLPWEIIKNYRIIDPIHHKVSRKTVSNVLESSNNNHGSVYASSISTTTWDNNSVYNYWFHDYNTSPYDGTTNPATDWKGIRLAYNTTAVDTIVKEATGSASAVKIEQMVPHISLYLGVPLSSIDSPWLSTKYVTTPINSETNDSVSWQHDPTKGRFLLNLLGLSDGFAVRILDKDMIQIPAVTTSVSEGGSWLTNASFGMVTFYGITHPHKRSDGGSNIDVVGFDGDDGNGPRMSFCRYIGDIGPNFNGGSSVTVSDSQPGTGTQGDLYYVKTSAIAGTLKINTGSAWVDVGGGVVEGDGGVSDGHLNIKGLDTSGTIITLETNSDLTVANPDVQDDGCFIGTFNTESFPQRTFSNTMSPIGLHVVDWQHDDIHTFNATPGGVSRKTKAPMGSNGSPLPALVLIDSTNPIYKSTTREVGFQYGVGSFDGKSEVDCGLKTNNSTNNNITYSCRSLRDQNYLLPYYKGNWTGHKIEFSGPNLWNSNQIYAIEMIVTENQDVVIRVHYPSTTQAVGYVPDSDDWVKYTFSQPLQSSDYPLRVAAKITVGSIKNCKMYPYTPLSVHNPHTINLSSPSFNFYTNRDANNTFGGISNLTVESTSIVLGGNLKVSPYAALKEINNRIKQGQIGAIDVKPILSITDTQLEVNGNMSIGTTYPLSHAKLHVNGTLFLGDGSGLIDGSLGGCIDFESRDSHANIYSSALIGTRTHNYTAGIAGGDDKMEMVFFMGNNPTGTYGPDRFSFIGGEFRIHTPNTKLLNTPSTGNKGWDALDEMGGRFENLTPAFIVNNQGNVGIGTPSPESTLQVNGDFHIKSTTEGWNTTVGKGLYLRYYETGGGGGYIQCIDRSNDDAHQDLKYHAKNHYFLTNNTSTRLTILENGNVGIGTTSPGAKLEIEDTVPCIRLTDDRYEAGNRSTELEMGKIEWYSRDGSWQYITPNLSHPFNIAKISVINKPHSGALPDCRIGFFTGVNGNVNEKMSIFSNGNVGIGVPGAGNKLDVAGDINFTGTLTRGGAPYPAAGGDGAWDATGSNIYYNTGKVGIGTDTPSATLEINGTGVIPTNVTPANSSCLIYGGNGTEILSVIHTNQTQGIQIGYNTIKKYQDFKTPQIPSYGVFSSEGLKFNASGTIDMIITDNGNVGIGETAPAYKLHVKGTIVSAGTTWKTHINNGTDEHTYIRGGKSNSKVFINDVNSSGHVYIGGQGAMLYVRHPNNDNLRIDHNQILTNGTKTLYLNHDNKAKVNICQDGVIVTNSGMLVANSVNYSYDQIWRTSGTMYMQYSGGGDLRLCDGGGFVGIGSAPSANLQVRGESRFVGYGRTSHFNYMGWEKKSANLENTYIRSGQSSGNVVIQDYGGHVHMCTASNGVVFINGSGSVDWDGYWTRFVLNPVVIIEWHDGNSNIGCYVNSGLVANWYGAESDRRIKKNIEDIDDGDALKLLRQIPVRYYNYKDIITKGTQKVAGFIAQEVKEVFPMAVSINPSPKPIPNIYKRITNEVWEEIPDSGEDIDGGENKWVLKKFDLIDSSGVILPPDISEGESYKFVVDASGTTTNETILSDSSGNFIFKKKYKNLFLYGIVINDFHIVDKNKIFAIGFSATQEIDRIQQAEKTKLEEQTTKLEEQTTKLAAAEIKINTLESENTALKSRLDAIETRLTSAGIN